MSEADPRPVLARAKLALLEERNLVRVERPPYHVALARVDGVIHAFEDACPHSGVSLASGRLIGHRVRCPGHDWEIDVRTGDVVVPAFADCGTPCFEAAVEGDEIVVRPRR